MELVIGPAKELVRRQVEINWINQSDSFCRNQKVFPWTNENINTYLKLVDFTDKDYALSVLASGDQPFNLVTNGINNIDTFDINPLTEYYALGLKRAMILKYDYDTFKHMITLLFNPWLNIDFMNGLIKDLFAYMEKEHRIFWEIILDYNYKYQKENGTSLNLILMLVFKSSLDPNELNNYLMCRENYNLLRSRLGSANLRFSFANALSLNSIYKRKFDLILLSNILDYFHESIGKDWGYEKLQDFERNLEKISRSNATIFLHYILHYMKDQKMFRKSIINNSSIKPSDLTNEELITLSSGTSFYDGMILKRVQ